MRNLQTKIYFILVFIVFFGFLAGMFLFVNYTSKITNSVIDSVQEEIGWRILSELKNTLEIPLTVNNFNSSFLNLQKNIPESIGMFQKLFAEELSKSHDVNIIALGLENGEYMEAQKLENGKIRIGKRGDETKGSLNIWDTDSSFEKKELVQVIKDYNHILRPWYIAAAGKDKPVWSDIYFYSSNNLPAISLSQSIKNSRGFFTGVLTTSISLKKIDSFLSRLKTSTGTKIVITDQGGSIVAASESRIFPPHSGRKIYKKDINDPAIKAALSSNYDSEKSSSFSINTKTGPMWVKKADFKGMFNLRWNIFVISPEMNFTRDINTLAYRNYIILMIFLVLGFIVTYAASKKLAEPVSHLADYFSSISFESIQKWNNEVPFNFKNTSLEIQSLLSSFDFMMRRLKETFKELDKSRMEYKNFIENINSIVMRMTPYGTITYCNPFALKFYGYTKEELIGKNVLKTVLDTGDPQHKDILEKIFSKNKEYWNGENINVTKEGKRVWILWSNKLITDSGGKPVELLSVGQDVTKRKEAQMKLEGVIEEKTILLKEVHHRVKNNLQIIISLINLQLDEPGDSANINGLEEIKSRIHSMALVHEMLYSATSFSKIDLHYYIETLSRDIVQTFAHMDNIITLHFTSDHINIGIDQAVTLGLLVNELINNAVQNAFKSQKNGILRITVKNLIDSRVSITIHDNGTGISMEEQSESGLGTTLIEALTDQLGAAMEKRFDRGTLIKLIFKNRSI